MEAPQKKTFYFVRHGESEENVTAIRMGGDSPLTKKGREQSAFLAKRFKTIPIDIIIASPYIRTRDTAEIFNHELQKPVEYSDLIVEVSNPSESIGLGKNDPVGMPIEEERYSNRDKADWKYSDEESFNELKERGEKALEFLQAVPHEHVAVVTHGMILKMMLSIMLFGEKLTPEEFWNIITFLKTANTGITLCEYDMEREVRPGWYMHSFNDFAHLGEAD